MPQALSLERPRWRILPALTRSPRIVERSPRWGVDGPSCVAEDASGSSPRASAGRASGSGRDRYSRSAAASGSCRPPPRSGRGTARSGDPSSRNQSLPERPTTFEARMTLSRLPRALNQEPMIRSVEPCVSGLRRDRVELGRVEEVDALVEGVVHLRVALGLGVLLAPGHGAEADQADIEVRAAEAAIFHGEAAPDRRARARAADPVRGSEAVGASRVQRLGRRGEEALDRGQDARDDDLDALGRRDEGRRAG